MAIWTCHIMGNQKIVDKENHMEMEQRYYTKQSTSPLATLFITARIRGTFRSSSSQIFDKFIEQLIQYEFHKIEK
jgi:hypothetical protein